MKQTAKALSTAIDPSVERMLGHIIDGKKTLKLRKNAKLFSQGGKANAIYFIQSGSVKLTVDSILGRAAVVTRLGPNEFFGEGCLVRQTLRTSTAATTESSTVLQIQRRAMLQALQDKPELSERFLAALLVRNIDMEEDIGNRIFTHTEKRLAHALLKLSRYGKDDFLPDGKLSQLSDETLADVVGTTPSRVLHFLAKFKKLGLVDYRKSGKIMVRAEMLADMVLHV